MDPRIRLYAGLRLALPIGLATLMLFAPAGLAAKENDRVDDFVEHWNGSYEWNRIEAENAEDCARRREVCEVNQHTFFSQEACEATAAFVSTSSGEQCHVVGRSEGTCANCDGWPTGAYCSFECDGHQYTYFDRQSLFDALLQNPRPPAEGTWKAGGRLAINFVEHPEPQCGDLSVPCYPLFSSCWRSEFYPLYSLFVCK